MFKRLNGIGRIDGPPDVLRIGKQRNDIGPVVFPGRADGRILLIPFGSKGIEGLLGHLNRGGAVNLLEIRSNSLPILPGYEPQRVPDHMHDTELDLGLREYGIDSLREAFEPIYAGNEDIFYPTVLEFGDNLQPEFCPLGLLNPLSKRLYSFKEAASNSGWKEVLPRYS